MHTMELSNQESIITNRMQMASGTLYWNWIKIMWMVPESRFMEV